MAGVGSRFHDDSKATLNSFLNEASAFILHILDHLAVRRAARLSCALTLVLVPSSTQRTNECITQDIGTSVVESLTATTVSAKSSRLSQALIRRQRRSLLQTPDLRSLGSHSLEIVVRCSLSPTLSFTRNRATHPSALPVPRYIGVPCQGQSLDDCRCSSRDPHAHEDSATMQPRDARHHEGQVLAVLSLHGTLAQVRSSCRARPCSERALSHKQTRIEQITTADGLD